MGHPASTLAGCAVGPNYVKPTSPVSATTPFVGSASPAVSMAEPAQDWWRLYNDPVLDELWGSKAAPGCIPMHASGSLALASVFPVR